MTKVTKTSEVKSSYGIVNAILDKFSLLDNGRLKELYNKTQLEKFYNKEIKVLKRDIKALKQNINIEENNSETKKEEIDEKIEDATGYIRDAYLSVKIEDIINNKTIDNFKQIYWDNISIEEKRLSALEEIIIVNKEETETNIARFESDIKLREDRISKIKAFI